MKILLLISTLFLSGQAFANEVCRDGWNVAENHLKSVVAKKIGATTYRQGGGYSDPQNRMTYLYTLSDAQENQAIAYIRVEANCEITSWAFSSLSPEIKID